MVVVNGVFVEDDVDDCDVGELPPSVQAANKV